jgi:hypothetical protein
MPVERSETRSASFWSRWSTPLSRRRRTANGVNQAVVIDLMQGIHNMLVRLEADAAKIPEIERRLDELRAIQRQEIETELSSQLRQLNAPLSKRVARLSVAVLALLSIILLTLVAILIRL